MRLPPSLLAVLVATACSASPLTEPLPTGTALPSTTTVPPPTTSASAPAPVTVSEVEREEEAARLRALGLEVKTSPVLAQPFAPPWSRRSFVVPGSWFARGFKKLKAKEPVMASALLRDLAPLEHLMRAAYGGWSTAEAAGFNWQSWFADWRKALAARGDEALPIDEAFAPMKQLLDVQLDNHTNIPLGLRFGSGSRSAVLAAAPTGPCDRSRHAGGREVEVSPTDVGQQPRRALRQAQGNLVPVHYVAYPARLGDITAIRCGGTWIDAKPVWDEPAPTRTLAQTDKDVPARRAISADAVLVRLPTFSKNNGEILAKELPKWPPRGKERVLVVDLRNNDGGDAAIGALTRWIDLERMKASMWSKRRIGSSCLYHALRWGYATLSSSNVKPPLSDGLRNGLQAGLDALDGTDDDCNARFDEKPESAKVLPRSFDPSAKSPALRIVALVNRFCGSDCEFMLRLLATMPETVIVGTNSFGVAQYIQPGYSVLPNTGLPFRLALGTADQFGDGRSFDGYGFDVDILLTTEAEHSAEAITALVTRLAKR